MRNSVFAVLVMALSAPHGYCADAPAEFTEAIELVHSDTRDSLQRAQAIADRLEATHPQGGYAETIRAEILSTWTLGQNGKPAHVGVEAIRLADRAVALNKELAQALVAKGRAQMRMGAMAEAGRSFGTASKLDPRLPGAMFMRADWLRRSDRPDEARLWFYKFINATSNPARKSNAYFWMGQMYEKNITPEKVPDPKILALADECYRKMVEFDPQSPAKLINYASFLNSTIGNFSKAREHAERAIPLDRTGRAVFQLATARYQDLVMRAGDLDAAAIEREVREIASDTGITLSQARQGNTHSWWVVMRLVELTKLRPDPAAP